MNKIKSWLLKNLFATIGLLVGAIAGYVYWSIIGCTTGSCPITASPYTSILFGALIGTSLLGIIDYKKNKNNENNTPN